MHVMTSEELLVSFDVDDAKNVTATLRMGRTDCADDVGEKAIPDWVWPASTKKKDYHDNKRRHIHQVLRHARIC